MIETRPETVYEKELREMSTYPEQESRRGKGRIMGFTIQKDVEGRLRLRAMNEGLSMSYLVNQALRKFFASN